MRYVPIAQAYKEIAMGRFTYDEFRSRVYVLKFQFNRAYNLFKKLENGRLLFDIDKHNELVSYRKEHIRKAQEYYYRYIDQPQMISEHCRRIADWSEKYPHHKSWRNFFQSRLWYNNDENILFLYQKPGMAVEFVRYIETTYHKAA